MKHILFFTPGFAADEDDSRCIPPLQIFARHLAKSADVKLTILSLHYPFTCIQSSWNGVDHFSCGKKGVFKKTATWWQTVQWFKKIHRENPVDLIHCFWLSDAALLGKWLAKWYDIPWLVTLMGQDVRPSNRYLRFFSAAKLHSIALSDFHAQQWEKTTGEAATAVIPWGIEASESLPLNKPKDIDIIGIGNLIPLKDYATFIQLLQKVKNKKPGLKALLIGEGPERKKLEAQCQKAGLQEVLQFTGSLPRPEVLGYLERSKILLHPSTFESFGFVFVEALATGAKIVSRPVGMAEKSQHWYLGNTEGELEQALNQALNSPEAPAPTTPFTAEKTVDAYLHYYQEILKLADISS